MHRRVGTSAKMTRARELLATLEAELGLYHEQDVYDAVVEYNEDSGRYIVWPKVLVEPPLRASLLVGECAYQMRGALDHLAHALVAANNGTPTHKTQFPICENMNSNSLCVAGGVSQIALNAIDTFQPYRNTDDAASHPLAILRRVSNIDKHRRLVLGTVVFVNGLVQLVEDTASGGRVVDYTGVDGHFDNKTPLCYFPSPPLERTVKVHGFMASRVIFNEPDLPRTENIVDVFTRVHDYVDRCIDFIHDETLVPL
jgi:hypothetical protein